MQMRPYGSSGLRVPGLGFGAMQIGDPALLSAIGGAFASHGSGWEGPV